MGSSVGARVTLYEAGRSTAEQTTSGVDPGTARQALATSALTRLAGQGVLAPGVSAETPLSKGQALLARDRLVEHGLAKPNDPLPRTYGELVGRMVRDTDGNGKLDIDLAALGDARFGIVAPKTPATALGKALGVGDGVDAQSRTTLPDTVANPSLAAGLTMVREAETSFVNTARVLEDTPQGGVVEITLREPLYFIDNEATGAQSLHFGEPPPPGAVRLLKLQIKTDGNFVDIVAPRRDANGEYNTHLWTLSSPNGGTLPLALARSHLWASADALDCQLAKGNPLSRVFAAQVEERALLSGSRPTMTAGEAVTFDIARLTPEQLSAAFRAAEAETGLPPLNPLGYVDNLTESGLADLLMKAPLPDGMSRSVFVASFWREGGFFTTTDLKTLEGMTLDKPIDGYESLGMDTFGERFQKGELRLPADFEVFTPTAEEKAGIDAHHAALVRLNRDNPTWEGLRGAVREYMTSQGLTFDDARVDRWASFASGALPTEAPGASTSPARRMLEEEVAFGRGCEAVLYRRPNELGQIVTTASFRNMETMLVGFSSMLSFTDSVLTADLTKLGVDPSKLSEPQRVFYGYMYYNMQHDPARAAYILGGRHQKFGGLENGPIRFTGAAGKTTDLGSTVKNSALMTSTWMMIDQLGIFRDPPTTGR